MKKLWLCVVVLVLVPLAGCFHSPPGTSVPFQVQGSATVDLGNLTFSGTAEGSFIGTVSGSIVLGPTGIQPCPTSTATLSQTVTLTAANGNTMSQTWSGTQCQSGPTTFHSTETYTITGGTGRFNGATGSGTVDGDYDVATSTFTFTEDGTICCL